MRQDFIHFHSRETFKAFNKEFVINDYTNIIDISEVLEKYKDIMLDYQVQNDERIEVISYNIYESSDYWDLLLLVNNIKDVRALPTNDDKLLKRVKELYKEYNDIFGGIKSDKEKKEYEKYLKDKVFSQNENYRFLKYIPKDRVNELKAEIKIFVEKAKKM